MPKIEDIRPLPPEIIPASIGGSLLYGDTFNRSFIEDLAVFCQDQIAEGRSIIAIVGGGPLSQSSIRRAQEFGVDSEERLDQIGIQVTHFNSFFLSTVLSSHGLQVEEKTPGNGIARGTIYIGGGDRPGHSTDYVSVMAACDHEQSLVLNLSSVALHPVWEGVIQDNRIIKSFAWSEYLKMFPDGRTNGALPFDTKAARLAEQRGITVALLGPDFNNVRDCISGRTFKGTILHP